MVLISPSCHMQVLCAQEFPYAGLLEKVDQELLWKVVLQPVPSCIKFSLIIIIFVQIIIGVFTETVRLSW